MKQYSDKHIFFSSAYSIDGSWVNCGRTLSRMSEERPRAGISQPAQRRPTYSLLGVSELELLAQEGANESQSVVWSKKGTNHSCRHSPTLLGPKVPALARAFALNKYAHTWRATTPSRQPFVTTWPQSARCARPRESFPPSSKHVLSPVDRKWCVSGLKTTGRVFLPLGFFFVWEQREVLLCGFDNETPICLRIFLISYTVRYRERLY